MAHGLDVCEVNVTTPFNPTEPWSGSFIDSKPDTIVKMMAHVTLTSLCESRLAATASLPITLLPIRNQENLVWQQRLEAVFNLEGPHFSARMASLTNLQHNTARTGLQQHMHLTAYEEQATTTSRGWERLRHETAVLRSGTLPLLD
jgi:hypothetical protein